MGINKRIIGDSGTTIIIFSCSLIMVFALSALVTDIGYIAVERYKLAKTADAAALAGAQVMIEDKEEAIKTAKAYVLKNQSELDMMTITVSEDRRAITVKLAKKVDYFFMRFAGYETREIYAESTAVAASVSAYTGIRPFGIEDQEFVFGQEYVLKEGAGDGESGNYGGLAIGEKGAANYRNLIMNGYQSEVRVGDIIETEPGNMAGPTKTGIEDLISQCRHLPVCTYDSYVKGCPRIIIIPVVDTSELEGRSECRVIGFTTFFIKEYVNNGGHSEVVGCFIKNVTVASAVSDDVQNFGTVGIRLAK